MGETACLQGSGVSAATALSWGGCKALVELKTCPRKLTLRGPWGLLRSPRLEAAPSPLWSTAGHHALRPEQPFDLQIEIEYMLALNPQCRSLVARMALASLRPQTSPLVPPMRASPLRAPTSGLLSCKP